jgi:hypothetical protein
MVGSGGVTFAVWAYAISRERDGVVELHPVLLAAIIGEPIEAIEAAIERLSSPDPKSRNPAEEGRRLVHLDAYRWRMVSQEIYAAIKTAEDLREYNRRKKRESRARHAGDVKQDVNTSQPESEKMPSQTETDPKIQTETQTEIPERETRARATPPGNPPRAKRATRCPPDFTPGADHEAIARERGADIALELATFRDHEFSTARADWAATFRNWLRRARRGPANGNGKRPSEFRTPEEQRMQFALERVQQLRAEEAFTDGSPALPWED